MASRLRLAAAFAALLAATSFPAAAPSLRFADPATSCLLVLGGTGSDAQGAKLWLEVDKVVVGAVADELASRGYPVEQVLSAAPTEAERGKVLGGELVRRGCGRVLQVAHFVEGEGDARRFGYEANLFTPVPKGEGKFEVREDWKSRTTHPLDEQTMKSLSMGELGRGLARELDASGVLTNRAKPVPGLGVWDPQKVLEGVAEARAAKEKLRASFREKQRELDAGKKEIEALRKQADAEKDPSRRVDLAADLETRTAKLRERFAGLQRELDEEERRATAGILERAKAVAEEVRSARKLEKVQIREKGGPAGEDLTAEVISRYDAKHPVAPAP